MSSPRNALGRGLGALIPGAPPPPSTDTEVQQGAGVTNEVPLDAIDPNPEQPRRVFDDDQLRTLADSIRIHGVLQPVVVRRNEERYELVVGERRWRAARAAGLDSIPAVVVDLDPQDRLEVALVENVQRHDLNPIELAVAFRALADAGATQDEIGHRVGMDRSSIANHIRLLDLPREIQEDVESARLSTGHAKALLALSNPERRRQLRDRIVEGQLSVRAAEELARPPKRAPSRRAPRAPRDPNLQRVADSLRERLQTRVRLNGEAGRGRIEIEYFGAEDLQRIAGILIGDV